jgi:hypothetical protein
VIKGILVDLRREAQPMSWLDIYLAVLFLALIGLLAVKFRS